MKREKLRRARITKGLSQKVAAELIGVSRNAWSLWELGKEDPYPVNIKELCTFFGVKDPGELDLMPYRVRAGKIPLPNKHFKHEQNLQKSPQPILVEMLNGIEQSEDDREKSSPLKRIAELPTSSLFLLSTVIASSETLIARRQILHNLLMIGSTALVLSPHSMLYSGGSTETLNLSVLDELEVITASYWRLCANTSHDLLGTVSEHFRLAIDMLRQILPHRTSQRLCSLSGEIAQILGKMLFDLQEYTLAWSYYMFSLKAAQAASNHDLWAVGIGRIILLLIYSKSLQDALPLLQEVHQLNVQNKRITCWLAAIEAELYAHLDNAECCDVALKAAKDIAQNEQLGEDRYATGFNASRLAGYEGACFVRLHQPDHALPALQQALSLLDPQAIRRRSTILTDIGIAYAQQGNILKACQSAEQALSLTKQTKSRAVLERVHMLHSELDEWKQVSEVQDLERELNRVSTFITA